jgi:hypothetical protein
MATDLPSLNDHNRWLAEIRFFTYGKLRMLKNTLSILVDHIRGSRIETG